MRLNRQITPSLLLAFFFSWQIETLLHLLLVPHTVCEHGKVVDADPESGDPLHHPGDEDNPNHKGCRVLALLTSAETRTGEEPPLNALFAAFENELCLFDTNIEILHGEELFRLSPSNSPPSIS